MTVAEKVAYLKGLCDGLQLDPEKKETKIITAIVETLEEISSAIDGLNDTDAALGGEIDEISDDLSEIEDLLFGSEDDESGDPLYQVKCPSCDEEIAIDEDDLEDGSITCPNCGEDLEFDLSTLDDCECGCDCGCGDD